MTASGAILFTATLRFPPYECDFCVMSTNMNEIPEKPGAPAAAEPKAPTLSSAANAVPGDLEMRVTKAKLALIAKVAELKNVDGNAETTVKRDAAKARLSQLEHHMKNVPDGFANASAEAKAKLETWLSQG